MQLGSGVDYPSPFDLSTTSQGRPRTLATNVTLLLSELFPPYLLSPPAQPSDPYLINLPTSWEDTYRRHTAAMPTAMPQFPNKDDLAATYVWVGIGAQALDFAVPERRSHANQRWSTDGLTWRLEWTE